MFLLGAWAFTCQLRRRPDKRLPTEHAHVDVVQHPGKNTISAEQDNVSGPVTYLVTLGC